ncbi:MAG TPA: hypothetical protein PKG77_22280 [Phycisphaerae bacterium]|nr:hypothetical protein [Phycisphaerae bacterium]HQL76404.1 hypothetical protein [Phycisphaerae bacterium]
MLNLATGAMLPLLVKFKPTATGQFETVLPVTAGAETFNLTIKGRGVAALGAGESWNPPDGSDVATVRLAADPKYKAFVFNFGQVPVDQIAKASIAVANRTGEMISLDAGGLAAPFVSKLQAASAPAPRPAFAKALQPRTAPQPTIKQIVPQVAQAANEAVAVIRSAKANLQRALSAAPRSEIDAELGVEDAAKLMAIQDAMNAFLTAVE